MLAFIFSKVAGLHLQNLLRNKHLSYILKTSIFTPQNRQHFCFEKQIAKRVERKEKKRKEKKRKEKQRKEKKRKEKQRE